MKTPILTTVYRILSGILFLAAVAALIGGLNNAKDIIGFLAYSAIFVGSGIVSLGIAEVVFLIAKIEYNTRESSSSHQMLKALHAIARNTAPAEEIKK